MCGEAGGARVRRGRGGLREFRNWGLRLLAGAGGIGARGLAGAVAVVVGRWGGGSSRSVAGRAVAEGLQDGGRGAAAFERIGGLVGGDGLQGGKGGGRGGAGLALEAGVLVVVDAIQRVAEGGVVEEAEQMGEGELQRASDGGERGGGEVVGEQDVTVGVHVGSVAVDCAVGKGRVVE